MLYNTFLFLLRLPKYDSLFIYSVTRVKQNVAERKRHEVQAIPAGVQTRNAVCCLRYGCGQKIEYKNGKNEVIEREKAQRLPGSAFDQSTEQKFSSRTGKSSKLYKLCSRLKLTLETFDFIIIIPSYFAI